MYEVTTATKTLVVNVDEDTAMAVAEFAFKFYHYVEVKEILSTSPMWYTHSVKILTR